jgi:hypothetical protein
VTDLMSGTSNDISIWTCGGFSIWGCWDCAAILRGSYGVLDASALLGTMRCVRFAFVYRNDEVGRRNVKRMLMMITESECWRAGSFVRRSGRRRADLYHFPENVLASIVATVVGVTAQITSALALDW